MNSGNGNASPIPTAIGKTPRDPKTRPNHAEYLKVLRNLGPEGRIAKAFELSELSRRLFRQGLRQRFPDLSEADFQELYLQRLAKCHNRNY